MASRRHAPYEGKTVMRDAFERAHPGPPALTKKCLRALRGRAGTFRASGWGVIRET